MVASPGSLNSTAIPIHILLVENNPDDAVLIRRTFLRAGRNDWKLAQVERLDEAIAICKEYYSQTGKNFDVILLDLRLPDSCGLETVVKFRRAVPDIPIVVITGVRDDDLAIASIRAGVQDYLSKDEITIQQLLRSVRFAIERMRQ
ncbi:response regulator [Cyanobacteria bacterium FACHB-DQ100]|uniref:response regulator n=1 Tax=unclassified Leptolyngbya TaxID=2650499 RepID=UPI001681750F|nr:response regulator [Leptolyngbya sp. FACHB-17]MBD1824169.1 response regulator [Cyanobacteria bacterium FACHB-DQ100]MBD2078720.1 response regulator [Leptolyngbya sp. FACHB-17]